ncbi:MAG: FGGY-family carbohydrate kinase, partial [Peptostreptococcaceae bacterium]
LLFNPSLAGGSGLDKSSNIRGAFFGIDLKHTSNDMARASLEGISLNLRLALDALNSISPVSGDMLMVGGGTKSPLWMQIFADSYKMNIVETNVGQSAGSLGAAAIAAVGAGLWENFDKIDEIHEVLSVKVPFKENTRIYDSLLPIFKKASECLSCLGDDIENLEI